MISKHSKIRVWAHIRLPREPMSKQTIIQVSNTQTTSWREVKKKYLVPPIYGWRILNHGNKIKNSTFHTYFEDIFSAKIKRGISPFSVYIPLLCVQWGIGIKHRRQQQSEKKKTHTKWKTISHNRQITRKIVGIWNKLYSLFRIDFWYFLFFCACSELNVRFLCRWCYFFCYYCCFLHPIQS